MASARTSDEFFFFSSRRRHTILQGDWSSDVCSSDLAKATMVATLAGVDGTPPRFGQGPLRFDAVVRLSCELRVRAPAIKRSEERRGGKEGRTRWSPDHLKKKKCGRCAGVSTTIFSQT